MLFDGAGGVAGTTITISAALPLTDPLKTGDAVAYSNIGSGSDVGGLLEGQVYWVRVTGANPSRCIAAPRRPSPEPPRSP